MSFTFPHRRAVIAITLFTLVAAALNAAEPLVLKLIFDTLEKSRELRGLLVGVSILIGPAVVREVLNWVTNWLSWHTRLGIHYALLETTVGKLHSMPLRMQRSEGVGAIMTKLDRSIQGSIGAVTQILFSVFPAVVYLVISVVVMLKLEWRLAMLVLVFAPLPAITAAIATPEQTRRERNLLDRWAKIYSRFNEVLSGIVTVRSFAMEDSHRRGVAGSAALQRHDSEQHRVRPAGGFGRGGAGGGAGGKRPRFHCPSAGQVRPSSAKAAAACPSASASESRSRVR